MLVCMASIYWSVTPFVLFSPSMAPRGRKPRSSGVGLSRAGPSHAAKATLEAAEHYENHVPEDDKVAMSALEAEVLPSLGIHGGCRS
jgi:hypothetical protein